MNGKEYSDINSTRSGKKTLHTYCHLVAFFNAFERKKDDETYVLSIVGKSASGKNYLLSLIGKWAKIRFPDVPLNFIVSDTTRPKRRGESDRLQYNFISPVEFYENIFEKKYVEYEEFNGWLYGTRCDSFDKEKLNIRIVTPKGYTSTLLLFGAKHMAIFLRAPLLTRLKRMCRREGKWKMEYLRRVYRDHRDFSSLDICDFEDRCFFDSRYAETMFSGQD